MIIINAINTPDEDHLAEVIAEMKILGSPKIRAFYTGEMYLALEGSHRIAAAAELGLIPEIVEVEESDMIVSDIDYPSEAEGLSMDSRELSVGEILSSIRPEVRYEF